MRRLSALVPAALLLGACADVTAPAAAPRAAAFDRGGDKYVTYTVNGCSDELLTVTGTEHYVYHSVDRGNGTFSQTLNGGFNGSAVSSTGATYRVSATFSTTNVFAAGTEVIKDVLRTKFVGQGGAPDDRYTAVIRSVTNSGSGDPVFRFDVELSCESLPVAQPAAN